MTKLDLDAAKKRCEDYGTSMKHPWFRDAHSDRVMQLVDSDLPAALRECAWSREMLERAKELVPLACWAGEVGIQDKINAFLRDLEKGPPDELA